MRRAWGQRWGTEIFLRERSAGCAEVQQALEGCIGPTSRVPEFRAHHTNGNGVCRPCLASQLRLSALRPKAHQSPGPGPVCRHDLPHNGSPNTKSDPHRASPRRPARLWSWPSRIRRGTTGPAAGTADPGKRPVNAAWRTANRRHADRVRGGSWKKRNHCKRPVKPVWVVQMCRPANQSAASAAWAAFQRSGRNSSRRLTGLAPIRVNTSVT